MYSQARWYISLHSRTYGPIEAGEIIHKCHSIDRSKVMIMLDRGGHRVSLDCVWPLLKKFENVEMSEYAKKAVLANIINTYIINKREKKLGKIINPLTIAARELPYSIFSFSGDWFKIVETELNIHLDKGQSWEHYSSHFRHARIPGFHMLKALRLTHLLRIGEKAAGYKPTSYLYTLGLSLLPVAYIFYAQNRINKLWCQYLKVCTRKAARFNVNIPAQILKISDAKSYHGPLRVEGLCKSISIGGLQFDIQGNPYKMEVGEELTLAFEESSPLRKFFPTQSGTAVVPNILLPAEIAWVSGCQIGIRFKQLPIEHRGGLKNYLNVLGSNIPETLKKQALEK